MCMICIDLIKHKMTLDQAERNLTEIVWLGTGATDHEIELLIAIQELNTKKIGELLDEGIISDGTP